MIRSRLSFVFIWLLAAGPILLAPATASGESTPGRTWHVAQTKLPELPAAQASLT